MNNGVGGLSVFWDLAHEIGHLLLFDFGRAVPEPPPWWLELPKRCARTQEEALELLSHEAAAWEEAEGYMTSTLPLLHDEAILEGFHRRRETCLDTYRAKVRSFGGDF